jgi:hypothetical protein
MIEVRSYHRGASVAIALSQEGELAYMSSRSAFLMHDDVLANIVAYKIATGSDHSDGCFLLLYTIGVVEI